MTTVTKTTYLFAPELWRVIKEFAGYSHDYPVDLPYYAFMLGCARNWSMTSLKMSRVKSLEQFMEKLNDLCEQFEDYVMDAFIPKQKRKISNYDSDDLELLTY